MRRKRILSQKRPAAGEEARERASFLLCTVSTGILGDHRPDIASVMDFT